MKHILFTLSLLALNFGAHAAPDKKETMIIKTNIACDHCLQCKSCGQNINDRIRDNAKGIRKVKINADANTIEVVYLAGKTGPEQIRKAISSAGFDADDVKASADGYAKLDGCCKAE